MEYEKKLKKKSSQSLENKVPKKKSKKVVHDEDETGELELIAEDDIKNHEEDEKVEYLGAGVDENGENWSTDDYKELIKRMEAQIPKNDTLSFSSRSEKLDWNQVKFGNHSVDDCYEKWKVMKSKVRHFRLLSEILQDAKIWAEKPWSAPFNKKKVRHPDQPPRPLSSFMLFYMEKKSKIIKRNPDLKLTEISRLIGEKYKALSDEKKASYKEKAREMQEEYKKNLAKFYEKHPELVKNPKKPLAPSNRPLPPFKLYLREKLVKRQNDENFNQQKFIEKYKEQWKSLNNRKKAHWIRLAKEKEDKYLEHLHDEEGDGDEKPLTNYKSVISKEEQSILDRLAGKPEKPPNSAYSLFSRLMLQDKDKHFVDGEPKNRMKEVAIKWKELPDDQRKVYAERVQHMHEHYKLEMANYLDTLPEDKRMEEVAKLQPKKKVGKVRQKAAKKATASEPDGDDGEELWNNEPRKPPFTAWDLFKTEFMKKNSNLTPKSAFKQAAAQWKTLSRKETEKYKKRHQQLKDKYMSDYEEFLTTLNEDELKEYSAWKKAKSGQTFNEESVEEDSSEEEEEDNVEGENSSSASLDNSSDESDSGVSEADV